MRISDWSSDVCSSDLADRLIALAEIAEQMGGRSFGAVRFADQSLRTVQRAGEIIEFVKIIVAIENFSRLVRSYAECVDECIFEMLAGSQGQHGMFLHIFDLSRLTPVYPQKVRLRK